MPILNKNKVYNRLAANALDYSQVDSYGISTALSALLQYYLHDDNYVNNKIEQSKNIIEAIKNDNKNYLNKFQLGKTLKGRKRLWEIHNNLIGLEDAKDIYLDMPQRNNTFVKADKIPTMGVLNNPHKSLYLSTDDNIIENYLIPAYHNIKNKKINGASDANINKFKPGDLIEIGKSEKNATTFLPILGKATVGTGVDRYKGPYVSYYDTWDVTLSGKPNTTDNVSKIVGGKPFDIYDRIYLDDYYGIDTAPEKGTYYGDYLPEIVVIGTKKRRLESAGKKSK